MVANGAVNSVCGLLNEHDRAALGAPLASITFARCLDVLAEDVLRAVRREPTK